jgi:peptidoglycan glycosyltransferase
MAKVLLAIFFAAYLSEVASAFGPTPSGGGLKAYRAVLGPVAVIWAGVLLLFLLERDLGTPVILFLSFLAVWFVATARKGLAFLAALVFGGGLYWASHLFPYVMGRIHGWADPWGTINTSGHQVVMSLFSIAEGGLLGKGFGQGRPDLVPAVSTDFIFDVFAEELGLVGGAAVILLLALLTFLCFRIALKTADRFPRLLATALGAQFAIQAVVILAGCLRALPITGVTLPFVSRGGSSLISSFIALALVSAVAGMPSFGPASESVGAGVSIWERRKAPFDRAVAAVARGFILCFLFLALLHFYWSVPASVRLATHPSNPRARARLAWAEKGRILDRSGTVLVESRRTPNGYERTYPQGGSEFVHVVGYDSLIYGQSGIEKAFLTQLVGAPKYPQIGWNGVQAVFSPADVQLTLDAHLQRLAQSLLKGKRGAAVVLNPSTGEVLALASSPSFSPLGLEDKWAGLDKDPDKPFINRATSGLYPPGSAFKIFTLSAALSTGVVSEGDTFTCAGKEKVAGTMVTCHVKGGHGKLSLRKAFTESCNIAFAKIGLRLGANRFQDFVQRFLLNRKVDFPLYTNLCRIPHNEEMTQNMLAECSFGQGALLVTPLHLALIASAIANGGAMVQPRLVERSLERQGATDAVFSAPSLNPEILARPLTPSVAQKVKDYMVAVVEEGTGRPARIARVKVAGKTGTAENPFGVPHAWFVAFAPADSPRVVVCVVVENAGWGATAAAPIARRLLQVALGK